MTPVARHDDAGQKKSFFSSITNFKDVDMLKHSLSERYKIMPRRLTGNTKKWQERVEVAIKRARHMALIPYIIDRKKVVENPFKL